MNIPAVALALALAVGSRLVVVEPAFAPDVPGGHPASENGAAGSIAGVYSGRSQTPAPESSRTPAPASSGISVSQSSPAVPDVPAAGEPRLLSAGLSDHTPLLGERFELRVVARIPPDRTVRFPDSLFTRTGIESIAAPVGMVAPGPGDSVDVTIVYPLRGMAWGRLAVPETELLVEPMPDGPAVPVVAAWAAGVGAVPGSFTRLTVTPAWVEVPQVLPPANPLAGFQPQPAFDVVGSEWGAARLGLASVVAVAAGWLALLVAGVIRRRVATPLARAARLRSLRRTRARRGPGVRPRDRALAEIDELLRFEPADAGELAESHARGVRSARGYLGGIRGRGALARTYRELIAELAPDEGAASAPGGELSPAATSPVNPAGDGSAAETPPDHGEATWTRVSPIGGVLRRAEDIRFNAAAVTPDDVRADLITLRDWVATYPPEPER